MLKALQISLFFFAIIFLSLSSHAGDKGFRYKDGKCINDKGEEGYNTLYFGQCSDLNGLVLGNFDFSGIDFSGSKMSNVSLQGSSIADCIFEGVQLTGANLLGVNASGARFINSNLRYARLNKAQLGDVEFNNTDLKDIDLMKLDLRFVRWVNMDFSGFSLKKIDFRDGEFENVNFNSADLNGANFSKVRLENVDMKAARLRSSRFMGATIKKSNFSDSQLGNANFGAAKISETLFKEARYSINSIFPFTPSEMVALGMVLKKNSVAVYMNPKYVEVGKGAQFEASALFAGVKMYEPEATQFENIRAEPLSEVLAENDVIMFPEMYDDVVPFSAGGGDELLKRFVQEGGRLIFFGDRQGRYVNALHFIFDWNIKHMGPIYTWNFGPGLDESIFVGYSQPSVSAFAYNYALDKRTLPEGAKVILEYENSAALVEIPFGDGEVIFFAYDWNGAAPLGTSDGGWLELLKLSLAAK